MTGSQMFGLILWLGGTVAAGFFFMGLGFYYRGKNLNQGKQDGVS